MLLTQGKEIALIPNMAKEQLLTDEINCPFVLTLSNQPTALLLALGTVINRKILLHVFVHRTFSLLSLSTIKLICING